jgi:exonuclease VII large subunit
MKVFERMKGEIYTTERNIYDYERLLAMSDPKRILSRGYALVYNIGGTLVSRIEHVKEGETLKTVLSDGAVLSRVIKKNSKK